MSGLQMILRIIRLIILSLFTAECMISVRKTVIRQ